MNMLPGWFPAASGFFARPATITQTDRKTNSATFSTTWTRTGIDFGDTGTVVIGICNNNGNISSVTVGGVAAVGSTLISSSTTRIWVGIARGVGTSGTVSIVSASAGQRAGFAIWQVEGDLLSDVPYSTDNDDGDDPTLTVDKPMDGFAVAIAHPGNADGNTGWTGLTEEWDEELEGDRNWTGATGEFASDAPGASVVLAYTTSDATNRCAAVAAFR